MIAIGTPLSSSATKVLFCGAGELGKEVIIELQRYGVEVVAVDRYENAPGMQVAHRSYVIDMLSPTELREVILKEKPDFIVPEIEAIATEELVRLEQEGFNVVPSAKAVNLTMNREGIRRLAAEELGIKTSPYVFASNYDEFKKGVTLVGIPCVVKPIMSSSGKGQSVIKSDEDIQSAWNYAQEGGRAGAGKVIVEGFVDFDYEITLLTVQHSDGVSYCSPIGHVQADGDYRESWQPQQMNDAVLEKSKLIASKVTKSLGGYGVFGVELFIAGDEVYFSEVSPRPHDTGLVTLISQDLSEFALHARAILGLPIPLIRQFGPSASSVILVEGTSSSPKFGGMGVALREEDTQLRLFGKPGLEGKRRMGVALARGETETEARQKAFRASSAVKVQL
ncbi:formate-dependent phosphoribosylglycinamide formyltransferase [Alkalimarinus sediminis]|uniref:Formate-dependent phosphoribosylglycinamide formyltransferase n=1 Tax=Alkalimarinus sediminis TaxID=1632866 RepID=A0A9E8HUC6_9ALTE|nr:formate-dependent phosphoribosylglycinamide formyltransferase [Alkalimarinus sediminis]UZW76691.1 formate-dependent phosphoribosylglycinamide formyltransferase [Alkalimarinus sediminis]